VVVHLFSSVIDFEKSFLVPSDRDIGPGHVILDSHAHLLGALSQLLDLHLKTEKNRECINVFYRLGSFMYMYSIGVLRTRTYYQIFLIQIFFRTIQHNKNHY
jgi:hypothetical protein